ncbi:MAG TPA: DUF5661 family protein [Thermodesulfobacteriota bacterium]|nr:DUF5661 family protein [Thermodesulfobacteriota bacterium]
MKLPEYVPAAEVKKTCKELKISDWTKKKKALVSLVEAKTILSKVNTGKMKIDPEEFRKGLEVELEHGITFSDANVTNNHPLLTGLIVMAHFKETLDYYRLLEVAELEGDLIKALAKGDLKKTRNNYVRLNEARSVLYQAQLKQLK